MTSLRRMLAPRLKPLIRRHSGPVGSIVEVRTAAPIVVLTYDDGPEPGGTNRVLEALDERGATATFFVLLTRARRNPSLLAEVASAGHEIALHGLDHRKLTEFPATAVRRRTLDGLRELEDLIGTNVKWMRPPYGHQTFASRRAVLQTGLEPVMWGATTWDSRDVSQEERVRKASEGVAPGSILLAHDGYANVLDGVDDGPPPRVDRKDLTLRVLDAYAAAGFSGSSLGAALEHGTPFRAAWFRR